MFYFYQQATVEDLVETEEESFDAVIASEVVEHVANIDSFLNSCGRLVKVSYCRASVLIVSWETYFVTFYHVSYQWAKANVSNIFEADWQKRKKFFTVKNIGN